MTTVTEFHPPIPTRDTEELIGIAHSSTDVWQQEAIDQANNELERRGITVKDIKDVFDRWEVEDQLLELAHQNKLKENETECYTMVNMVCIFFMAPFILIGKFRFGLSLIGLRRENYKLKFRQRQLLLLSGIAFWISLFFVYGSDYEIERQREIDSADITEWEKSYYGTDAMETDSIPL